jgi:hypothetical protein
MKYPAGREKLRKRKLRTNTQKTTSKPNIDEPYIDEKESTTTNRITDENTATSQAKRNPRKEL